tara:strand:- start:2880 stop:3962 length:1083 start_codon:yes stop_codon:yes gene_type:complete
MAGWHNSEVWSGLEIRTDLADILLDLCLACKERFSVLGQTLPTYHTDNGDKSTPVRADFVGLKRWEIYQTLDDIADAIDDLVDGFTNWNSPSTAVYDAMYFVDPDEDDHAYTNLADLVTRSGAPALPTDPDDRVTNTDTYEYYKDLLNGLVEIRFDLQFTGVASTQDEDYYAVVSDSDAQTAWDALLAASPTPSYPTYLFPSFTQLHWSLTDPGSDHQFGSGGQGGEFAKVTYHTSQLPSVGTMSDSIVKDLKRRVINSGVSNSGGISVDFYFTHGGTADFDYNIPLSGSDNVLVDLTLDTQWTHGGSDEDCEMTWHGDLPSTIPGYLTGSAGDFAGVGVDFGGAFAHGKIDLSSGLTYS